MSSSRNKRDVVSPQAKEHYDWATAMLGAVFASSSLISLIQHGLNIHLSWGFADFVRFYRGGVDPLLDVILWPLHAALASFQIDWQAPRWLRDLWTLSFVFTGMLYRGILAGLGFQGAGSQLSRAVSTVTGMLLFGLTGFAIPTLVFSVLRLGGEAEKDLFRGFGTGLGMPAPLRAYVLARWESVRRSMRVLLFVTLVAVVTFYVGNSIVPQLELSQPG